MWNLETVTRSEETNTSIDGSLVITDENLYYGTLSLKNTKNIDWIWPGLCNASTQERQEAFEL